MISIIIPVYNNEKYISKCIDSVIKQNTMLEYEILIVDDGSTDRSLEIIRAYEKMDQRIKVITQSNAGVSAARNVGVAEASGDYVMFLDSDDWLESESLVVIDQKLKEFEPDILVYGIKYLQDGMVMYVSELEYKKASSREECIPLILEIYKRGAIASSVNKIYKKTVLSSIPFEMNIKYGEDLRFNLRTFSQAASILVIPDAMYIYNKHENSLTTTLDYRQIQEMLQLYDISNTFFDELNVDRKVKEGLLEKHYYKYLYPYHITRILENKKLAYSEKCKWINEFLDINYISYLEKDTGMFSRLLKRREYRKLIWYCKLLKLVK